MAAPNTNRLLSIAAASGRIGYVLFLGAELKIWGLSKKASKNPQLAAAQAKRWIAATAPDAVVTEKISATLKGDTTQALITAIQRTAAEAKLLDVSIARPRRFANKYAEAAVLAARYPALAPRLPTERPFYDPEPLDAIFIDALILAEEIIAPPPHTQG